ncbi:MAG: hypothetical protein ACLFTT_09990 [Candidatus Hydrogenedentota bacterium]
MRLHVLAVLASLLMAGTASAQNAGTLLFPNSDFERGDLSNWQQEGEAFQFQPTKGDNSAVRDMQRSSKPQGDYYVATYERYQGKSGQQPGAAQGNAPQGALLSTPFIIEKPYIGFLIGGGDLDAVGVRLVVGVEYAHEARGDGSPTMRRMVWDVSQYQGEKARIYIFDHSSEPWGIVNADDFRAYDTPPEEGTVVEDPPEAAQSIEAAQDTVSLDPLFPNSDFSQDNLSGWTAKGALAAEVVTPGKGSHFEARKPYLHLHTATGESPPLGTLTSPAFTLKAPVIRFSGAGLGAEIRLLIGGQPVLTHQLGPAEASDPVLRRLEPIVWDVADHVAKEVQIAIAVDGRDNIVNAAVGGFTQGPSDDALAQHTQRF